jgi:hypothetical protein
MLSKYDREIKTMVNDFLGQLVPNMHVRSGGLIFHGVKQHLSHNLSILENVRAGKKMLHDWKTDEIKKYKEKGYESVILYRLSVLRTYLPHHPIWSDRVWEGPLHYITTETYKESVYDNDFSNVVGFENALTAQVFLDSEEVSKRWINRELNERYTESSKLLSDDIFLTLSGYKVIRAIPDF